MASPYGPALGTPSFGAAAAAHGTPMTGGRFQTDDAFGRDSRFERGFGSGSNPGAFGGDAFPGARAAVRDRDLRTSAAPDYAPLLFGASPGPVGGPSPARGGFEHATGAYGDASLHTPGPAARRTPGFFGAGSGRDAPGAVRPGTGGKKIFGGGFALASGGTGAGASDGSGRERSPRSPRLSGMSPAGIRGDGTPAGHVSTPWADRSSRREQRRGGSGDGAFDAWDDDADTDVPNAISEIGKDERWVVVYGFDPDRELNAVLLEFQKDGDVEAHVAPRDEADANFAYVRFADAASARRALRRNGRRAGGRMVGVAPLDARSRAKLRDMYGDEGLARREPREGDPSLSRARRTPGGSGSRRIIRARAGGAAAPSSRPHCWRPTRDGVALQPRRAFWDKVTEFVFGC